MPTHAEIERKLDELMVPPTDGEKMKALDAYFDSLSAEDREYASLYGVRHADESMRFIMAGLRHGK